MRVTKTELDVIVILFLFKGLRACDIAAFRLKNKNVTVAQEKSAYNILRRLYSKGIVTRLKNAECEHSFYYLSVKGYEYIKQKLDVPFGEDGNGLLPIKNDTKLWDVPYQIYKPPRHQLGHYLMTIDFVKELLPLADKIRLQTAYYCNLKYEHNSKSYKIKPDAALQIDNKYYAVEVDTGTESKQQLIAKFTRYKQYCVFCKKNDEVQKVHTILFVVPDSTETALKRRWTTVLEAFYTAFNEQLNTPVSLIFVPLNEVKDTVFAEIERERIENELAHEINDLMQSSQYLKSFHYRAENETKSVKVYLNDTDHTFMLAYAMFNQAYETRFFLDKYTMRITQDQIKKEPMPLDRHYGYQYNRVLRANVYPIKKPICPSSLEKTGLSKEFIHKLLIMPELYEKYKKYKKKK